MTNLLGANLNSDATAGPQGEGRESPSTFPAYPSYKYSRVEWLDTLPAHWEKVALKWVSRIFAGGTPDKTKTNYWENGSIPWLNSGAVNQVLISEPSAFITTEAFNSSSARWIPAGSLVMALAGQGKTKGMVAQLAIRTTCNQSMAAITPAGNVKPRYLFWWLSSNYQNIRNMAGGDLRDGLNLELIGDIPALMPSEEEQTQIARFLDHETARIDALIEEQQRLIEFLKEKRQAVISLAVTKGLDQSVPMKDSGVEWLGEVPAHWIYTKLGRLAFMQEGPGLRNWQFTDQGTRVICVTNITEDGINFDKLEKFISEEEYRLSYRHFTVRQGDLMLSSSGNSWGKVAEYTAAEPVILNTSTIRLNELVPLRLVRKFLRWFLESKPCREQLDVAMTGACQPNFGPTHLNELVTTCPPIQEQFAIAGYLDIKVSEFKELISVALATVDLLQERRSALISAAVTGKIDVRGWQPPASSPTPESVKEAV